MAASSADTGYGADLLKGNGDGPPESFTTFGVEIVSLTPPNISRSAIDVTHLKSDDEFREFIAGIMDAGEITIEINYVPSASDVVYTALLAGKQSWQISLPGSITWTFAGLVTNYSPTAPLDDKMSASVTFKVSGKPVLA